MFLIRLLNAAMRIQVEFITNDPFDRWPDMCGNES